MVKRGGTLWQNESYDHWIRNEEEFARAVQYILDNPRKAGLSAWPWVYVRNKEGPRLGRAALPSAPSAFWFVVGCLDIIVPASPASTPLPITAATNPARGHMLEKRVML
jgi:hypothetical protein